ncbi:MAG: hypothetical protein AAGD25_12175 [Cyanobacteria bacterium P01_F01_bin.150]
MSFIRQYVAPFFIVLIFLVAMIAVSARIFLPSDLAAPAPIEEPTTMKHGSDSNSGVTQASIPFSTAIAQFSSFPPASDKDAVQNG